MRRTYRRSASRRSFAFCFEVGDRLLVREDEAEGLLSYGNDIRIMQLLYKLLRRVDEEERFEMIRQAVADGDALGLAAHEVAVYAQEHGERSATGRELKAILVEKVRAAAKNGTLLGTPSLGRVLYRWQDLGSEDGPRLWANEVGGTDDGW